MKIIIFLLFSFFSVIGFNQTTPLRIINGSQSPKVVFYGARSSCTATPVLQGQMIPPGATVYIAPFYPNSAVASWVGANVVDAAGNGTAHDGPDPITGCTQGYVSNSWTTTFFVLWADSPSISTVRIWGL